MTQKEIGLQQEVTCPGLFIRLKARQDSNCQPLSYILKGLVPIVVGKSRSGSQSDLYPSPNPVCVSSVTLRELFSDARQKLSPFFNSDLVRIKLINRDTSPAQCLALTRCSISTNRGSALVERYIAIYIFLKKVIHALFLTSSN